MDIKQLEAFVYTVKYKSFSQAAQELFLTQPTISSHIHSLEKELHTELIHRTTRDFYITAAGLRLYEYALSILNLRNKAFEELSGSHKKLLCIGASSVPTLIALPGVIYEYHKLCPDTIFHIYSSDSLNVIKKVSDGSLDVGLVGTTVPDSPCTFLPFASDDFVIATPNTPHYRDLQKNKVPLETLLSEPMIMREDNSGTKMEMNHFFQQLGISPDNLNIIAYMNQPELIRQSIILGLGISIMSSRVVEYAAAQNELLIFPLKEYQFTRNLYLAYVTERYLPDLTLDFIRFFEGWSSDRLW